MLGQAQSCLQQFLEPGLHACRVGRALQQLTLLCANSLDCILGWQEDDPTKLSLGRLQQVPKTW